MNRQNSRPGLLMWALAALALAAAVARFAAGMSGLDNARYAGDWNVSADQMSVQAIDTPEWGETFYDYYLVSFRLTNHSQRLVDLPKLGFGVVSGVVAAHRIALGRSLRLDLRPQLRQERILPGQQQSQGLDLLCPPLRSGGITAAARP